MITGSENYKGNFEKADRIRKKAIEELRKAENILEKKIKRTKEIENLEARNTSKIVDFGVRNQFINERIKDYRRQYKNLDIFQRLSGKRSNKLYKWYTIINKTTNEKFTLKIDENGIFEIGKGDFPIGTPKIFQEAKTFYDYFESMLSSIHKN